MLSATTSRTTSSDRQGEGKAAPSAAKIADGASPRRCWDACLRHVAQYRLHLVMAVMLALVWVVLPLQMSWSGQTALLVSALLITLL
ncbi:hypothetical protein [Streptomyces sp. NPDC048612]|uniref:hypothetical protein n=1 Tax=Streptomyces sp. NPDC048612 TaxID=3365579 RepID=UPI00371B66C0